MADFGVIFYLGSKDNRNCQPLSTLSIHHDTPRLHQQVFLPPKARSHANALARKLSLIKAFLWKSRACHRWHRNGRVNAQDIWTHIKPRRPKQSLSANEQALNMWRKVEHLMSNWAFNDFDALLMSLMKVWWIMDESLIHFWRSWRNFDKQKWWYSDALLMYLCTCLRCIHLKKCIHFLYCTLQKHYKLHQKGIKIKNHHTSSGCHQKHIKCFYVSTQSCLLLFQTLFFQSHMVSTTKDYQSYITSDACGSRANKMECSEGSMLMLEEGKGCKASEKC